MDELEELHAIKVWLPSELLPTEEDESSDAELGSVLLRLRRTAGDIEAAWGLVERAQLVIDQQIQILQDNIRNLPRGSTDYTRAVSGLARSGLKDLLTAWEELAAAISAGERSHCQEAVKLGQQSQETFVRTVRMMVRYQGGDTLG